MKKLWRAFIKSLKTFGSIDNNPEFKKRLEADITIKDGGVNMPKEANKLIVKDGEAELK